MWLQHISLNLARMHSYFMLGDNSSVNFERHRRYLPSYQRPLSFGVNLCNNIVNVVPFSYHNLSCHDHTYHTLKNHAAFFLGRSTKRKSYSETASVRRPKRCDTSTKLGLCLSATTYRYNQNPRNRNAFRHAETSNNTDYLGSGH